MSNSTELVLEVLRLLAVFVLAFSSAESVQHFTIHRMQQLDIGSTSFGSRVGYINMEVRSELAPVLNRRCIFVKWVDLSAEKFDNLIERGMGAIVIVLPTSPFQVSSDLKSKWMDLEQTLLLQDIKIPVYFVTESEELIQVMNNINVDASSNTGSVLSNMFGMFQGYGYYVTTQGAEPKAVAKPSLTTMQGLLKGQGIADQLPTIGIVAHYDAFGMSTGHSTGGDSNASGVAALLELARLFSKLYSNPATKPHYNLLLLATSGGKLGYFGSKKWLEQNGEEEERSWLLSNTKLFVCLDALGNSSRLHFHVAKVPKEGSPLAQFADVINKTSLDLSREEVSLVHKKIRVSDDLLSWEHERFALLKQPAATLSHHMLPQDNSRHSVFDDESNVDMKRLALNVQVLAEAIAKFLYNISTHSSTPEGHVFGNGREVNEEQLLSYMRLLSGHSRSPQVLTEQHQVVQFISQTLSKFTTEKKWLHSPGGSGEMEFTFYDSDQTELQIFRVKPPIFDLFLAILIAVYIGVVFLALQNFHLVSSFLRPTKSKAT